VGIFGLPLNDNSGIIIKLLVYTIRPTVYPCRKRVHNFINLKRCVLSQITKRSFSASTPTLNSTAKKSSQRFHRVVRTWRNLWRPLTKAQLAPPGTTVARDSPLAPPTEPYPSSTRGTQLLLLLHLPALPNLGFVISLTLSNFYLLHV
jgi:hypothetical protein